MQCNYFFPISHVIQINNVQFHKLECTIGIELNVRFVLVPRLLDTNITKVPVFGLKETLQVEWKKYSHEDQDIERESGG